ncbi:hypothetical protein ACVWY3_001474 [Bradyrhizobium sp. USDA 4486]
MFLLGAVTLCCAIVAGTLALLEPVFGQRPERQPRERQVADADRGPIDSAAPVRVIGAPFVPNVNPRER